MFHYTDADEDINDKDQSYLLSSSEEDIPTTNFPEDQLPCGKGGSSNAKKKQMPTTQKAKCTIQKKKTSCTKHYTQ